MKLSVVLNASAGSLIGKTIEEVANGIKAGFERKGVTVLVHTPTGEQLEATLKTEAKSGIDALIIGGGDGTIATAASIAAEANVPLGVLPFGTMNLLARDLSIPLVVDEAVEALAIGDVKQIDLAEINGKHFLCNSVLGLMPIVAEEREAQRGKPLSEKVPALARRVFQTFYRFPGSHFTLETDQGTRRIVTRMITVANNAYEPGASVYLKRTVLDSGKLTVYLSHHKSRLSLILFSFGFLLGLWQHDAKLETISTSFVTISRQRRKPFLVAIDGESVRLESPLRYRILPGALKVLVPKSTGKAELAA